MTTGESRSGGTGTAMAMAERIREALEDAFEQETRKAARTGPLPTARLHDHLTGVADHHEPRVRLLFELVEDGSITLDGDLADVPATCFFLGDRVRYQRSLRDWARLLGPSRRYELREDDPAELVLWSAGDLLWRADRSAAEASRDFLAMALDRPVPLLRAQVATSDLRVLAVDAWSGRDARRVAVAPEEVPAETVEAGESLPWDVPLLPAPRI